MFVRLNYINLTKWMFLISFWQGSLKTVKLSTGPCSSINGLVSSFVSLLQVKFVVQTFYIYS